MSSEIKVSLQGPECSCRSLHTLHLLNVRSPISPETSPIRPHHTPPVPPKKRRLPPRDRKMQSRDPIALLIPLILARIAIAHDPVHTFCDLIAVPLPPQCSTLSDCSAVIGFDCSDNTCACGFTQQAQTCVQCIASADAVDKYNAYLNSCQQLNLVDPTATLPVYGAASAIGPASTVAGASDVRFTDVAANLANSEQGGMVSESALDPAASPYPQAQPPVSAPGHEVTPSVYRGIASPIPSQPAIPAPLNGPSGDSGATNPTGLNTADNAGGIKVLPDTGTGSSASSQAPAANDSSTAALVASRNFFSSAISEACVRHCTSWKKQADVGSISVFGRNGMLML